jgi:hypothetical protein
MKLGGVTSKRKKQVWNEEQEIVETRIWNLTENLKTIFNAKLGAECTVISGSASFMYNIISKAMPYEVILVPYKEWADFKGIETKNIKIYTGWYDQNPIMDWAKKGIITKEDYIMIMGKDKNFTEMQKGYHTIDVWMNTEGDLGLKFEKCDHYHTITRTLMGIADDTIEFTTVKDGCSCGFKGDAFTWKEKEV